MNNVVKFLSLLNILLCTVAWTDSNDTPLHEAIKANDVQAVEQLLVTVDVNSKDDAGKMALLRLAIKYAMASVNFIKPVANINPQINSKDNAEKTALHYAAQYNSVAVAQWLIEHGADINAENADGYTPLHYASTRFDGMEMAKLLVAYGAHVCASNNVHEVMPCELANDYKNKEVAQYLINETRWKFFNAGKFLTIDGQRCGF